MSAQLSGWTSGPDGRRYPPRTDPSGGAVTLPKPSPEQLAELAALINSGVTARAIDAVVDDPELVV